LTLQGVGGAVQFPKNFLSQAFEKVREHGGLCISDEVGLLSKYYTFTSTYLFQDIVGEFVGYMEETGEICRLHGGNWRDL